MDRSPDSRMTYDPATYWPERAERQGYAYVAKGGSPVEYDAQRRLIEPHLERLVPACDQLLDFGCGPGRFTDLLAGKTGRYVGVDLVAQDIGREFYQVGDAGLPFTGNSFDCVVAVTVLQHITDPDGFRFWCAELGRVLAPGGHLVVWDHYSVEGMDEHMRPRGPQAIEDAVGTGPFTVEEGDADHWVGVYEK